MKPREKHGSGQWVQGETHSHCPQSPRQLRWGLECFEYMLKDLKEKMEIMNKQINLKKEMEAIRKEPNENSRNKKCNN